MIWCGLLANVRRFINTTLERKKNGKIYSESYNKLVQLKRFRDMSGDLCATDVCEMNVQIKMLRKILKTRRKCRRFVGRKVKGHLNTLGVVLIESNSCCNFIQSIKLDLAQLLDI